jgi:hypothetical protein
VLPQVSPAYTRGCIGRDVSETDRFTKRPPFRPFFKQIVRRRGFKDTDKTLDQDGLAYWWRSCNDCTG